MAWCYIFSISLTADPLWSIIKPEYHVPQNGLLLIKQSHYCLRWQISKTQRFFTQTKPLFLVLIRQLLDSTRPYMAVYKV